MQHHLAILYGPFIDDILAGRKTVECRLGRYLSPPHEHLKAGDFIWLRQASGLIRAVATAKSVRTFDGLTPHLVDLIQQQWGSEIHAPQSFWRARRLARFATLIWLGDICVFKPFRIEKRDRRAWVVLQGPPIPGQILQPLSSTAIRTHHVRRRRDSPWRTSGGPDSPHSRTGF